MRAIGNSFGPLIKYKEPMKFWRDDRLLQCKECFKLVDISQLRVVEGHWVCVDCIHEREFCVKNQKTTKRQISS